MPCAYGTPTEVQMQYNNLYPKSQALAMGGIFLYNMYNDGERSQETSRYFRRSCYFAPGLSRPAFFHFAQGRADGRGLRVRFNAFENNKRPEARLHGRGLRPCRADVQTRRLRKLQGDETQNRRRALGPVRALARSFGNLSHSHLRRSRV